MNIWLVTGALCSAAAALVHVGCIIFGASWYRFMGAGEQMAQWAIQGDARATQITAFIAIVLSVWSLYALSGARVIGKLPLLKFALVAITSVYLLRGVAGLFFIFAPTSDRTAVFWLVSSLICCAFGFIHFIGVRQLFSPRSV